jgi:hypothetical protein
MAYSIDANLLLYAVNSSAQEHLPAVAFIEACAAGEEVLYLTWPVVMAFLRISTHPGIFPSPLTYDQAMSRMSALLDRPQVRTLHEGRGFWASYVSTGSPVMPRGNLVPDAHIAAILRNNDIRTLYSNDADFRRFDFLRVINPLLT